MQWNNLQHNILNCYKLTTFKTKLIKHLFKEHDNQITSHSKSVTPTTKCVESVNSLCQPVYLIKLSKMHIKIQERNWSLPEHIKMYILVTVIFMSKVCKICILMYLLMYIKQFSDKHQ